MNKKTFNNESQINTANNYHSVYDVHVQKSNNQKSGIRQQTTQRFFNWVFNFINITAMELGIKKVVGKVKRTYCKRYLETGELCKPAGWFEKIEICEKCKNLK